MLEKLKEPPLLCKKQAALVPEPPERVLAGGTLVLEVEQRKFVVLGPASAPRKEPGLQGCQSATTNAINSLFRGREVTVRSNSDQFFTGKYCLHSSLKAF